VSDIYISPTSVALRLERYEIEALIEWHREQEINMADKQMYSDADDHKRHGAHLRKLLAIPSVPTVGEKR
jgi:hypothetical protein